MAIIEVKLDGNMGALIKDQKGSIESVRDILILELLEGDWGKASYSWIALKTLLQKD